MYPTSLAVLGCSVYIHTQTSLLLTQSASYKLFKKTPPRPAKTPLNEAGFSPAYLRVGGAQLSRIPVSGECKGQATECITILVYEIQGVFAEISSMDKDYEELTSCTCCCGLDSENADEDAEVDQHDMAVMLFRTTQDVTTAADSCLICSILADILKFFDAVPETGKPANIALLLPVGIGNVQLVFNDRGSQSVVQIFSTSSRYTYTGSSKALR